MPPQRPPGSRLTCRARGLDALKIASVWEQGTTRALLCIISSPSYGRFSKLPAVFCEDFPPAIERNLLWEQTHPQGWFTRIQHVKTPMHVPSAPSLPPPRSVCSFCLWDRQQDYGGGGEEKKKQLWGFPQKFLKGWHWSKGRACLDFLAKTRMKKMLQELPTPLLNVSRLDVRQYFHLFP